LTIVPFTLHPVFHRPSSFSDILNYNTNSRASLFKFFFWRRSRSHPLRASTANARGARGAARPAYNARPYVAGFLHDALPFYPNLKNEMLRVVLSATSPREVAA